MKDPLTKQEKRELFANFKKTWEAKYHAALLSGAMPDLAAHDHCPAKFCLIIAAEQFAPWNDSSRKELANLRKFI